MKHPVKRRLTQAEEQIVLCALSYCREYSLSDARTMLVTLAGKVNALSLTNASLAKEHQTDQYHIALLMDENVRLNKENVQWVQARYGER